MIWEESASALCAAPPQAVWDVLLDGRRWSLWNPGVEWMWLEGDAVAGTLATIKLRRVRQTAFVIQEVLPPQRFAIGLKIGPVAQLRVHWSLAAQPAGTRIDAGIAIAGIAAGLLLERSAKRVAQALPGHLERLAARALEQQ
jgi:carbon monoxide dehydrogenase subunit G